MKEKLSASVECLEEEQFSYPACERLVLSSFKRIWMSCRWRKPRKLYRLWGLLLSYLGQTQRTGLERLEHLNRYTAAQFMGLDFHTRRNPGTHRNHARQRKEGVFAVGIG